jgi:hypothetical protein
MGAFQNVVEAVHPGPELVAKLLTAYPGASRMFLRYPMIADLPAYSPSIGMRLCEYAESCVASSRYPALAMASLACRAGAEIRAGVGVQTLVSIRRSRFDIRLVAAAASLASSDVRSDPTVRALAGIIETLTAHIQSISQV